MAQIITLTSDFGSGYYVGEMKGVIKKVSPQVELIDITHHVSRHDTAEGAFILSRIWRHFPKNTIHVAVIDPGVGTDRRGVAVETDYCFLIGPDNGLLRWALMGQSIVRIVELDVQVIQQRTGLGQVSSTFHGRDVFAPAAALLSKGVDLGNLGRRINDIKGLDIREDTVVHVDGFGNVVTTIAKEIPAGSKVKVYHGARQYEAVSVKTYAEAEVGRIVVLSGSHGLIEVGLNMGSAAEKLGIAVGDKIRVEHAD